MAKKKRLILHLSPADNHRYVMGRMKQRLAYDDGDVCAWQRKLRRKPRELIGAWPEKSPPLRVQSLWQRKHQLGTIEKIAFAAERYADVTAYVCLPESAKPPYPFMICLQGQFHRNAQLHRR